jgi:hypothetical protein
MSEHYKILMGDNFDEVQLFLGKRPGDYRTDPYYLRKGMANKPYFWDEPAKKWRLVRLGDEFYKRDDGTVFRVTAYPVSGGKAS